MSRFQQLLLLCVAIVAAGTSARETTYRVGGDVKPPIKIKNCEVSVPPEVRGKKIVQPFFIYEVVISKAGRAETVKLIKGPHGDPYDAIERVFRKQILCSQWRPGTLHGRPVAVYYTITASAEVR